MERISVNYSLKNIPVPPPPSYKLKLTEKIESFIKRMRWKANFNLNKDDENRNTKLKMKHMDLRQENAHHNVKKWKTSRKT